MHQQIYKKKKLFIYIFLLFLLSTVNNISINNSENLKLQGGLKIVVDNSNETLNTTNWYFGYGASITSSKSGVEAIQKLSLGGFDAAIILEEKMQKQIFEINQKVIKKILTVPLTNIANYKKVSIYKIE